LVVLPLNSAGKLTDELTPFTLDVNWPEATLRLLVVELELTHVVPLYAYIKPVERSTYRSPATPGILLVIGLPVAVFAVADLEPTQPDPFQ
jgi:hypothetical protein